MHRSMTNQAISASDRVCIWANLPTTHYKTENPGLIKNEAQFQIKRSQPKRL